MKESEIIQKYLPEQLSEEEVVKIAAAAVERVGAKDVKDFGRVMAGSDEGIEGPGGRKNGKRSGEKVIKLISY